jgi:hypothetical protein
MGAEEFRANLLEFVRRAHDECGAEMILQTGCAVAGGRAGGRGRYPAFMDIVREVAGQTASVLADHHADWEATLRRNPAAYESWMSNRFHPGPLRHWVLASRLIRELRLGELDPKTAPRGASRTGPRGSGVRRSWIHGGGTGVKTSRRDAGR